MKYALVTGADHGVGLALVKELLERGYFVVAARFDERERQVDALGEKYPGRLALVQLDVGSDESVAAMKAQTEQLVPCLDMVINDAGILGDMAKTLGEELDFDEMLRVINVNALGALRVSNALVGLVMRSTDKTIVNITSEAGSIADCERVGWFGYCMSKAANNMQSALVYNNIREKGGRVVAVHPGHVATYMRGHLDITAKIGPEESAKGILRVVLEGELAQGKRPAYVDYTGKRLPW